MKLRLAALLASWFGCGYAPAARGTWGSLGALAAAVALQHFLGFRPAHFAWLALAGTAPGVWAAGVMERQTGKKDPSLVVIDEVLGQWLTLAGAASLNWKTYLAAFVLFRWLDIWKPPPVRQCESLGGGVGVVADDLMAGIYGALVLFAARWFNL